MKEKALQIARSQETEALKINRLREYLQHLILREMFELDWLSNLIFHGGTALRIIHDLNRFSEDLDFHLPEPNPDYNIPKELDELRKHLQLNGYTIELSPPSEGKVKTLAIKFAGGLLYEAGISPHQDQKLSIKLEIDSNPPRGFTTDRLLIQDYFPFALIHHDRASFLAGKCHSLLQRDWTKGRDYFDLLFYLTKWDDVIPNLEYLNNALDQTGYRDEKITEDNWKKVLLQRIQPVNWDQVENDVRPFLLDQTDLKAFRKEFLIKALS